MEKRQETYELKAGQTSFTFLKSGDLFEITHGSTMINQLRTNDLDGSLTNLYLQVHSATGIKAYPLLGVKSPSQVAFSKTQAVWQGEIEQITYRVTFTLAEESIWFWEVELKAHDVLVDVIYGQDLGLANRGMIQANEAYTC